jgi:hypothetical protein
MEDCKSMSSAQLVEELQRIAHFPHRYDNRVERKASIANELAARVQSPTLPTSIIVLEK